MGFTRWVGVGLLTLAVPGACSSDAANGPAADTADAVLVPDVTFDTTADVPADGDPAELIGCGDVPSEGACTGAVLLSCGAGGPVTRDCAATVGTDGLPFGCAFVAVAGAYDCIANAVVPPGGCGDETFEGRCNGTLVVYCESPDSGPASYDCAPEYECGVAPDGIAGCRLPGTAGCGGVTYEGYCEGTTAVWCDWEATEVQRYDCAADATTCGFVDDETGYYCIAAPSSSGTYSVTGAFEFEKPALTTNGLGAIQTRPVRGALVQVRSVAGDEVLGNNLSNDDGTFEIGFEASGDVYVMVLTTVDSDRHALSVRDCPLQDCDGTGYVHAAVTESFTPEARGDIGGWVIGLDGSAGAFNIFDVFLRGLDFAWDTYGVRPPPLIGQWARGSSTTCGDISCFSAREGSIFVLGLAADTDEFDDPVLGHEFGHFLEQSYSRSDSPGGYHDGTPTDPRLAWGEGYGTFAGCELMGSSVYIDTTLTGTSVTDISDTGVRANPNGGLQQLLSEYLVAQVLWTLSRGGSLTGPLGSATIFDVLGHYLPAGDMRDRGVDGVDLVDFLDGLMCRGRASEVNVRRIVIDQRKFPYDFAGPGNCQ